jgi:hypothetical protein
MDFLQRKAIFCNPATQCWSAEKKMHQPFCKRKGKKGKRETASSHIFSSQQQQLPTLLDQI